MARLSFSLTFLRLGLSLASLHGRIASRVILSLGDRRLARLGCIISHILSDVPDWKRPKNLFRQPSIVGRPPWMALGVRSARTFLGRSIFFLNAAFLAVSAHQDPPDVLLWLPFRWHGPFPLRSRFLPWAEVTGTMTGPSCVAHSWIRIRFDATDALESPRGAMARVRPTSVQQADASRLGA